MMSAIYTRCKGNEQGGVGPTHDGGLRRSCAERQTLQEGAALLEARALGAHETKASDMADYLLKGLPIHYGHADAECARSPHLQLGRVRQPSGRHAAIRLQ